MKHLSRHVAASFPLARVAVLSLAIARPALATPQLPVIPPNVFSILDYGGSTASADNSTAILNAIGAARSAGGGTVVIPSGTFAANPFTITTGTINLQIDGTLRAPAMAGFGAAANYITWSNVNNVRMSGAGTIDGQGADWWSQPPIPAASRPRLVRFNSSQTVEVTGLTTINSPSFFFALSGSAANYTFNNLTITAPADSPNTDGIDVAGSNILITNCTIAVGDDNIAVKAGSQFCSDITISHNTFGSGHGVSVGGGSAFGLSSMLVTSCTFNGTTNGLRLKAQDASGGNAGGGLAHPVTGVTYDGITMTNVAHPIVIDSFYNGGNNFPSSPTDPTHYPSVAAPVSTTTPMWENISFANITATGGADAGLIYGLNTVPNNIQGLSFDNVHLSARSHMNLWYASDVDLSGLTISVPPSDAYANATPVNGAYLYAVTVPEPSTAAVGFAGLAFTGSWLLRRRRAATPGRPRQAIAGLLVALAVVIGLRGSSTAADLDLQQPISRIALGSCIRQDKPQPIWAAVAQYRPDVFLMLGDNVYGDTEDMEVLRRKYAVLAANEGFAAIRRTVPILAVWDDHDYGANDAGREYPMRRASQQVFLDFFEVPATAPLRTQEGIYRAVTVGPPGHSVQFICLDTRSHRSALVKLPADQRTRGAGPYRPTTDASATVLGAEQAAWLEDVLHEPAEVRIVLSSIQFACTTHQWEHWGNFPTERAWLLKLIRDSGAAGVVFVSGDRHAAEISRIPAGPDAAPYPLYDLTASSLNQPMAPGANLGQNPLRLGPHQRGANFGTIDIDWNDDDNAEHAGVGLTLAIRDVQGGLVHAERVQLADLAPAPATP